MKPAVDASAGELIRWSFETLNTHTVEPLREFWTDETVERFPDATYVGSAQIAAFFESLFAAVPDLRIEPLTIAEDGEHVFVQWRLTGHHTGTPFQGIEATGKRLEIDGIDHFVIRDRKVASNFVVFDQMQFARAIGLMPPDGSAADKGLKKAFNAKTKLLRRRR